MKQVLQSPNISTMVNDLIKNYSQTYAAQVEYFHASHRDSETRALQNGSLERHAAMIEDHVQYQTCFNCQGEARHFVLWKRATRHCRGGQKQAEQRINSRSIIYVFAIHNLALQHSQRSRHHGQSAESNKLKRTRDCLTLVKKHKLRNDRGAQPRGRAKSNAHARTRIRAVRHGERRGLSRPHERNPCAENTRQNLATRKMRPERSMGLVAKCLQAQIYG